MTAIIETGTNGAEPKSEPSSTALKRRVADLEKQVAAGHRKLDEITWLFAEFLYNMKLNAARQALANPQVMEALAAKIAQGRP